MEIRKVCTFNKVNQSSPSDNVFATWLTSFHIYVIVKREFLISPTEISKDDDGNLSIASPHLQIVGDQPPEELFGLLRELNEKIIYTFS